MKTQREIMEQREKNKCTLYDMIEKYSGEPINLEKAERLSAYRGAYKALCMIDGETSTANVYAVRNANNSESTPELDGDTEFERVIMDIPADRTHMVKITHIFNKHMEGLAAVNRRAYNNIMEQLREVANS